MDGNKGMLGVKYRPHPLKAAQTIEIGAGDNFIDLGYTHTGDNVPGTMYYSQFFQICPLNGNLMINFHGVAGATEDGLPMVEGGIYLLNREQFDAARVINVSTPVDTVIIPYLE